MGASSTFGVNESGVPSYRAVMPNGVQAYRYKTSVNQTYLGPGSQGQTFGVNSSGQVAYTARDSQGYQHVMVDGHDFYADVFSLTQDPALQVNIRGIDEEGRAFWSSSFNGATHVFLGNKELSPGALDSAVLSMVNPEGDAAWGHRDIFVGTQNISGSVLGSGGGGSSYPVLDSHGNVLWAGIGSATGMQYHVFLNSTDLTGDRGVNHGVSTYGIADDGTYLWGYKDTQFNTHLMRNQVDLTELAFGSHSFGFSGGDQSLGPDGSVVWMADDLETGYSVVFHNTEDISSAVTGGLSTSGYFQGLDGRGNAVWAGGGLMTGGRAEVFVNQFNLSQDALYGQNYRLAGAMAVGLNGHVLWYTVNPDATLSVYLSTPVPEPSILLGALGFLFRRRIWKRQE